MPDRLFISFLTMCLVAACMYSCHKESEYDKVKKVVLNVQKATEEKDIRVILDSISKTYRDPQGNAYDDIKGLVLAYFYRYQKISLYIPSIEVAVENSSAKAAFQAIMTGRGAHDPSTAVLPESIDAYAFDVSLKKEPGGWKIVAAKWERIGDMAVR